ncbi:hypothetical protein ADIS_4523 [Lunatimonas lonarensis]|uniref:Uncharacterized protein n=1 Tax=Lunatimonas lonarensis TaxID=1232681 RepID=R7ZLW5_9BACT|nr:hypothetical protein ADIS_4523 [Lunatimonas lonarensis]
MRTLSKSFFLFVIVCFSFMPDLIAQCAMCRATIENNVSNGDTTVGAGLNMGILYLFAAPYLLAMVIGFFWYRNAKLRKRISV